MRKKNGKVYTNYRCRTYAQMLKSACTKRTISEEDIANAVLAVIQKYIEVLIDFEEVLKNADYQKHRRSQSYAVEKRLNQKQRELDDIERIKMGLYTDLKKNIITQDDYVSLKAGYAEQAVTLSQQIGSLKDELKNLEKQDTMQNEWLERFRKHRNIEKLTRPIVTELIDVIYIHEGRQITIKFKFQDEFEKINEFMEREDETVNLKAAI